MVSTCWTGRKICWKWVLECLGRRQRSGSGRKQQRAPSKSKLPKKSLDEVGTFQQNAKTLFQEVDRILRELEQHPSHYPEPVALPHPQAADQRSARSESPPPLPRKPPSPKVTFNNSDVKPDSNVNLARKSSTKRGPDPREQQHLVAPEMVRQDSSRHRNREADLTRSASERVPERHSSRKYEEGRDDPKRSDSRRHPSEAYRTDPYSDPYYKGYSDRDKDYKRPSHNRYYSDSREKSTRREGRRQDGSAQRGSTGRPCRPAFGGSAGR
ncbi:hypothetical protein CPC08DRAFT_163513 [Agrocybe pediades]|nr:hypothetical protein CPC08DRAFT_163513 [Agrocybe pediades]